MNSLAINHGGRPGRDTSALSCVLAIEPDANQAQVLEQVLSGRIGGSLRVVESTEAALKALVDAIPDLVLVSPLLSPRTEDQFMAHLRALGVDASHLRVLSIPRFGETEAPSEKKRPFRLHSMRKLNSAAASCDPVAFANEVAAYLTEVSDARQGGFATVAPPEPAAVEPSVEASVGVRLEHIERLLERLRSDPMEQVPDTEPAADAEKDAPGHSPDPIPGQDAMPIQITPELTGSAAREPGSQRVPRFLTLDTQISSPLRALLDEADGCLRMSFFTGGGACAGRALDLLLAEQGAAGGDRSHQIQELGKKHPAVAESFLRVLSVVMNDQSGVWETARLTLAIAILKAIAYEIYVLGPERAERTTYVIGLLERFNAAGKGGSPGSAA